MLDTFYSEWRVRCGVAPFLREDTDSPPERLLQAVWLHQRLLRDRLTTLDGHPVRVLHPGFHNLEGGPDFLGAVVQVGEGAARTGDIEVDLRASGWRAHGHDRNPAFQNVILHVTWECEHPVEGAPPLMPLRQVLDAPLGELSLWLGGEAAQAFPPELRGQCCKALGGLAAPERLDLLHQAAHVRLRSKAAQFQARARQVGWEQALWEGLFRALGYKHNIWPMQRLAELRPRWITTGATEKAGQLLVVQSRLLGLSGLLPVELTRSRAGIDTYLRRIWDLWWRERDAFSDGILPRQVWRLHGLRPANHPERRLALAAAWITAGNLPNRLEDWCALDASPRASARALLDSLQVPPDEFWSRHWTLRSARLPREQPLLGPGRLTDLALNVVIPWLWIRAVEGKNQTLQTRLERRYFGWPCAEDNAVLRLARRRLLGQSVRNVLPDAAAQQGLMQIVRDFCDHSNAVCQDCKLPRLVREFVSTACRRE